MYHNEQDTFAENNTMMSIETIVRVNQEIAAQAAQEELVPYVPFSVDEIDYWPPIPFPHLGSNHAPDGWEKTETRWFVDKTGHGSGSEPALTCEQFKRELRRYVAKNPSHGFGIVEEGEFQAVVSAFIPTDSDQQPERP
ncbi:MAG: hypothetical protein HQ567_22215 [Candidatus Nealsonbacteria bacterium]|nr:hypothetical protein [Candidatus Nealsonbacteria bacterium]